MKESYTLWEREYSSDKKKQIGWVKIGSKMSYEDAWDLAKDDPKYLVQKEEVKSKIHVLYV